MHNRKEVASTAPRRREFSIRFFINEFPRGLSAVAERAMPMSTAPRRHVFLIHVFNHKVLLKIHSWNHRWTSCVAKTTIREHHVRRACCKKIHRGARAETLCAVKNTFRGQHVKRVCCKKTSRGPSTNPVCGKNTLQELAVKAMCCNKFPPVTSRQTRVL